MKEHSIIDRNLKFSPNSTGHNSLRKNSHRETNSCNSCGLCNRLRRRNISPEQASAVVSDAKASGRETCAVNFIQQHYGNRFTSSALNSGIQKKCACGGSCSHREGEEEAEKVSMNIMRMESGRHIADSPQPQAISHKPYAISHTPFAISRLPFAIRYKPSSNDEQGMISEIRSNKGSGEGLDDNTRSFMEQRIGYDFGNVRVHTDNYAVKTSRALNAEAFTVGRDVFFNEGRYTPSTTAGRQLLSHELTHVIQQGEAPDIQLRTERGNNYRVDDAEDCRGNWQQIGTAVAEARRMVAAASAAVQPETRRAERIRNAMQTHFHLSQQAIDDRGDFSQFRNLVTVINMFRRINNAFSGIIPFECERTGNDYFCRNTLGYVRLIFSDIHLCPQWFGQSARDKAVTVIHEMGHKYANLDDEAYEHEAGYRRLSPGNAADNADSYACFARDVS